MQGGKLSPFLFNIYIDVISEKLNNFCIGCNMFGNMINHLIYADDLILFAPSIKGLQYLVDTCVCQGQKLDVKYNELKSKFMYLVCNNDKNNLNQFPNIKLW